MTKDIATVENAEIPVLDLRDDAEDFSRGIGNSYREFGFALVSGHGIPAPLIEQAWRLTSEFFDLPESEKRSYHDAGLAGARGYTPFGTEIAKGASVHDLKEFWHIGRDLPPGDPLRTTMPDNVWPSRPAGFRETFSQLFAEFDRIGAILLSRIAVHLGLSADWFDPAIENGNSVLRLLHYPPVPAEAAGAERAGPHEDINLISLLLGAEEAGLELLGKDGQWKAVSPPPGAMAVNIGDMLQRLTNHVLPSTTHRVRNPAGARAMRSRYSMPFFLHPRSDLRLETIPTCRTPTNPDRYPHVITADEYLQERLKEIGLIS